MSTPASELVKPAAFILTGSFPVISRDPLYVSELSRRGLTVLVITSSAYRERATAQMAVRGGPMSAIAEIAFVDGDVTVEGSFIAGAIATVTAWPKKYTIAGVPLELEILNIALRADASYPAPYRFARQVYLEHEPGVLEDVTVTWPDVQAQWIGEGGVWPEIKPGPADDEPTLRAVLVLKDRGGELVELESSDDRAVAFFIDAPAPDQLDEIEQRVRAAITIRTRRP